MRPTLSESIPIFFKLASVTNVLRLNLCSATSRTAWALILDAPISSLTIGLSTSYIIMSYTN